MVTLPARTARPPRRSRARDALVEFFTEQRGFVSTADVHLAVAREIPTLSRTTVHRILQCLSDEGVLDVVRGARGGLSYRRCRRDDGHVHLLCTGCDLVVEIDPPPLDELEAAATLVGSVDIAVTVSLVGLCPMCARSRRASAPAVHGGPLLRARTAVPVRKG